MGTCKICGRNCEGEYCFYHKPRKPLKNTTKKYSSEETKKMMNFFLSLWRERTHKSELSGDKLSSPPSSLYFHHILPKRDYKEAAHDKDNIILVTMDEHGNVERDPNKYETINNKRKALLKKYKNKTTNETNVQWNSFRGKE
jgi:hypothetical protein